MKDELIQMSTDISVEIVHNDVTQMIGLVCVEGENEEIIAFPAESIPVLVKQLMEVYEEMAKKRN